MDKTFFERWVEENQETLGKKFYELKVFSLVDCRRLLNLLEMAYNAGHDSVVNIQEKDCADEAWAKEGK